MFRKQKDEILGHIREIHRKQKDEIFGHTREIRSSNPDIPNLMANMISLAVCENAQSALDLASTVMEISTLGIRSTEISQHTTNQVTFAIRFFFYVFFRNKHGHSFFSPEKVVNTPAFCIN